LALALFFAGCAKEEALPSFEVTSFAFGDGETIPLRHTCEGDDLSPPLVFEGAPEGTAGYAIVMTEAGEDGEGDVARWAVWGIPAEPGGVEEGIPLGASPGDGLSQGRNDLDALGYSGPCPEDDGVRSFSFQAYALAAPLALEPGVSISHVTAALSELAIGSGALVGTYPSE